MWFIETCRKPLPTHPTRKKQTETSPLKDHTGHTSEDSQASCLKEGTIYIHFPIPLPTIKDIKTYFPLISGYWPKSKNPSKMPKIARGKNLPSDDLPPNDFRDELWGRKLPRKASWLPGKVLNLIRIHLHNLHSRRHPVKKISSLLKG